MACARSSFKLPRCGISQCGAVLVALLWAWPTDAAAQSRDWPTARGNSQRTSCVDGLPGPRKPRAIWVHRSREHFIAPLVCDSRAVFISGLGPFNTAQLSALSLAPDEAGKKLWSKSAPVLKLPVVGTPALVDGRLIFGDGMHQTDGAVLHCATADSGRPLWEFDIPGKLVHVEGTPTVLEGRIVVGAGHGGVICLDPQRLRFEGRDQPPAAVHDLLEQRWKQLVVQYEAEKRTDPDFAVPPSEDALPKAHPHQVWQQGRDELHVDAPLAAEAGRVYVASAYLDAERTGRRVLQCLQLSDGKVLWSSPLTLNPWAGPTLAGGLVIVGASSIRFEPREVFRAQGAVAALASDDGRAVWKKTCAGGIVSPIAASDVAVYFTATDGKIRAWAVADGQEQWTYDGGAPFFAGVALGEDVIYAADLKGVVHAVQRGDGRGLWKFDLARDPQVKSPGMVYGTPLLQGGRLYIATCNLEDANRRECVVVCLGD